MHCQIAATVHMDIHLMESFAHVAQCENLNCQRKCCCHLMQVATHAKSCAIVKAENRYKCHLCRQVLALCAIHLENCRVSSNYPIPTNFLLTKSHYWNFIQLSLELQMFYSILLAIQKMSNNLEWTSTMSKYLHWISVWNTSWIFQRRSHKF